MSELSTLPEYESRRFMRWLAKATEEYFKNPENQRKFEEWQKEQEKEMTK